MCSQLTTRARRKAAYSSVIHRYVDVRSTSPMRIVLSAGALPAV